MNPNADIPADATPARSRIPPDGSARDAVEISAAGPLPEAVLESARPEESAHSTPFQPVLVEVDEPEQIPETCRPPRRRAALRAVCAGALALALAAGSWFAFNPTGPGVRAGVEPAAPVDAAPSEPAADALGNEHASLPVKRPGWEARMEAVERLRAALLAKAGEVRTLQQEYRYGVMELEEDLLHLIKRHGLESLSQAMRHRPVEFGLLSIQSRRAYAAGLAAPLRWLAAGSEELLFLQRQAELDLEVLPLADGVDMEAHAARIDAALRARQPTPERLAMAADEPPPSLETIWKRLADQAKQVTLPATYGVDTAIAEEVCSGDLTRYGETAVLRLKTARCLAESEATELFLNRVSELPAAAAQKLSQWPGSWLCLNGLKRLTPETARHLFAWPGRWISMNGLSELPADASTPLANWGGRQLELMGLKKVEAIQHLARWEEAGGKLFIPIEIRRQVDAWRTSSRPPVLPGKENR